MATFLVLGTYTAKGRAGLIAEGGTSREKETRALFEKQLGGRVVYYAFLMGGYDFILIVELPDDASLLAPILLGTAGDSFTVTTCKVISPAELDTVSDLTKDLKFRLAGS